MTLQEAFYRQALSASGITDLIAKRLYPVRAPDANPDVPWLPYAVYRFEERKEEWVLTSTSPMITVRLEVDAYSSGNYDLAWRIAEAVRAEFGYFCSLANGLPNSGRGPMGGPDGLTVTQCLVMDMRDEDHYQFGSFCVRTTYAIQYPTVALL